MDSRDKSLPSNSPLVDYALRGLQLCWLPRFGRWSHIYHLDNRDEPNESVPQSDQNLNLSETFRRNVSLLLTLPVSKYAFGMALWVSAELQFELPGDILQHIELMLSDKSQWRTYRAQDLGMIVVGVVAQAKLDKKKWSPIAAELFSFLVNRYHSPSGLFFDAAFGPRRRFASFATQTYLLLACYAYGEFMNDSRSIEIANTGTRKLIALQGPNGEWPWFFDAVSGVVVDFYELYSVHQYGMAPAFLKHAEQHGVSEARSAIIKGFNWVLGQNQLALPMLVPNLSLTIRSQVRKGELHTKNWRALRAIRNSILGRAVNLIDSSGLELRRECRSYELGWILWSFGRRADLTELTHHEMFIERQQEQQLA
jgi:hypothetical protein